MWFFGKKLMRPAFALLGAVAGGFLGFFIFPTFSPAMVFGAPSPYLGLAAGGAMGLVAGVVLYRFAVAIVTATALGTAGVLIAATALHFGPIQDAPQRVTAAQTKDQSKTDPAKSDQKPAPPRAVSERVTEFLHATADEVVQAWDEIPAPQRTVMTVAGLGGAFLGFLVGVFMPGKSAAGATALFGAGVWLPSALWLLNAADAPGRTMLNRGGAIGWLVVWLTIGALGFAFQLSTSGKKRKSED
jgi:hypothetical protein